MVVSIVEADQMQLWLRLPNYACWGFAKIGIEGICMESAHMHCACNDSLCRLVSAVQVGAAATATAGAIQNYAQKQMAGQPGSQEHAKVSPTFKRG